MSVLPKDVTHYVVPDCTLARDYLELLEIPEITAIIFLQTVANSVSTSLTSPTGLMFLQNMYMALAGFVNKRGTHCVYVL